MRISREELRSARKVRVIPRGYGLAYWDYARAEGIYYPLPINFAVRYGLDCWYRFLRLFYWIGLIDVGDGEIFLWREFYRIKSH